MRNPSLKQRHWEAIESILNFSIKSEDSITLGLLTNLDAFSHTEEIEEVSGQASSEAALETLLKKVMKKCNRLLLSKTFLRESELPTLPDSAESSLKIYQSFQVLMNRAQFHRAERHPNLLSMKLLPC